MGDQRIQGLMNATSSYKCVPELNVDLLNTGTDISASLYIPMCSMCHAFWIASGNFNRGQLSNQNNIYAQNVYEELSDLHIYAWFIPECLQISLYPHHSSFFNSIFHHHIYLTLRYIRILLL